MSDLIHDGAQLIAKLPDTQRVVFDLDGTLYDTRDFERPALGAVANWLRVRSGEPLKDLTQALWSRRETARHQVGLFDDILREYGLPADWGSECAQRFRAYPGDELAECPTLRQQLLALRSQGRRLALVTNGRAELQARKLALLNLTSIFDVCVCCDPTMPHQLKPSNWAWAQLAQWQTGLTAAYVGDDPVDAGFAKAGGTPFIPFSFRNPIYGN